MDAIYVFVSAVLAEMPKLIALGANILPLIDAAKAAILALSGQGTITNAQIDHMNALVAEAERAWAVEVEKAQKEVDGNT